MASEIPPVVCPKCGQPGPFRYLEDVVAFYPLLWNAETGVYAGDCDLMQIDDEVEPLNDRLQCRSNPLGGEFCGHEFKIPTTAVVEIN